MYNIIYDFLEKYQLIYSLQIGFQQNYLTSYAFLNLTESIMKAFDEDNFAYGIFVDLQKAFDTVDHNKSGFELCVSQNAIYFSILAFSKEILFYYFCDTTLCAKHLCVRFFVFLP